MIFLRHDGPQALGGTPKPPSRAPSAEFDTNQGFGESFIAVTHSKQMTRPLSIQYKSGLHHTPPLCQKIADHLIPKLWDPRA
jgi:hypothetical protein